MGMSDLRAGPWVASFAILWLLWPVGSGCSACTTPDSPVATDAGSPVATDVAGPVATDVAGPADPEMDTSIAFPNILNLEGVPAQAEDWSVFSFSDLGSWQSFGLSDETLLGGFSGPFGLLDGRWITPSFMRLSVRDVDAGVDLDSTLASDVDLTSYPGRLQQSFVMDGLRVQLDLRFVSSRSALVSATVFNQRSAAASRGAHLPESGSRRM